MTAASSLSTDSDLKHSDNFVLLLGAGFSAPGGFPVMTQFMRGARRRYQQLKNTGSFLVEHYRNMFTFQLQCLRKSGWCFQRDWENIEELYTQADLRRLADITDKGDPTKLCDSIAWSIWDTYRRAGSAYRSSGYAGIPDLQAALIAISGNGYSPIVITTNYDLLVEMATLQANGTSGWKYYYPGFTQPSHDTMECVISTQKNDAAPSGKYLPVIKLHGSANWFEFPLRDTWVASKRVGDEYRRPDIIHNPDLDIDQFRKELIAAANQWVSGGELLNPLLDGPFRPAIIPPMLGKMSVSYVIARQWRAAIEALGSAREIWIIGYSFPETDSFMPRLLSEGIQDNDDLDSLMIVNTPGGIGQLRSRLERILTPTVNANRTHYSDKGSLEAIGTLGRYFESRNNRMA
jgi:hypothetical protein